MISFASLHQGTKDIDDRVHHHGSYTETVTELRDPMTSMKLGVNVTHYISHLIRADESRNTQFLNGPKKLEALVAFADLLHPVSGWY